MKISHFEWKHSVLEAQVPNFDKIFDESIPIHQHPLGPIRVLDEESSSNTKRDSKKICSSLEWHHWDGCQRPLFLWDHFAQLQGCTVAPQDLLRKNFFAFSFFPPEAAAAPLQWLTKPNENQKDPELNERQVEDRIWANPGTTTLRRKSPFFTARIFWSLDFLIDYWCPLIHSLNLYH